MQEQAPPRGRNLTILYFAMLASRVGFGVIVILFPLYIMKSTDLEVAGALALYPIMEAGAALPLGRLCDTRGRRRIFASSLGFMAAMMVTIGLTRDIYAVATIHALMGIGAAGVTVSTLAMITDLTARENRGAGMGGFGFVSIGGYAIGLLLGSKLDQAFASDLSVAFFVTGAAVASAFGIAVLLLREPPHPVHMSSMLGSLKSLDARAKAVIPVWLGVSVLLGFVFFLPRAFEKAGITQTSTAEVLVAGILVLGMGAIGFGALSDVIGRGRVMLIGVVGLFGLLATLGLAFTKGFGGLLGNLPLVGVFAIATSALVPSILATAADGVSGEARGAVMGLYSVMLSGGTAAGTLLAGVVHRSSGLPGIFAAGAAVFAAAATASLVLWLLTVRSRHGKPL